METYKTKTAAGSVDLDKLRLALEPMLENYKEWKAMLDLNNPNYDMLWPSVMGRLGVCVEGGEQGDPTSSFVTRRIGAVEELKAKVGFIETLVSALDDEGKRFVEVRYFQKLKRDKITSGWHISDSTYMRIRRKVLDTFLVVLGIISKDEPFLTTKLTPTVLNKVI